MGGGKLFIPREQVRSLGRVPYRSFMPEEFSNLTEQQMVDLISHIKTIN